MAPGALQAADLQGGDLYGGDLYGGDLYGGDLQGGDLQGDDLYRSEVVDSWWIVPRYRSRPALRKAESTTARASSTMRSRWAASRKLSA